MNLTGPRKTGVSQRRTEDGHAAQADDLRRDHHQQRDAQRQRQQPRLKHQHGREQSGRQQMVALPSSVSAPSSALQIIQVRRHAKMSSTAEITVQCTLHGLPSFASGCSAAQGVLLELTRHIRHGPVLHITISRSLQHLPQDDGGQSARGRDPVHDRQRRRQERDPVAHRGALAGRLQREEHRPRRRREQGGRQRCREGAWAVQSRVS